MASCNYISGMSQGIYDYLGSPTWLTPSAIQSKLLTSGYVGKLDGMIDGNHTISVTGCINPDLTSVEMAIYFEIACSDYYASFAQQALGVGNAANINWTSMKEADSSITRDSPLATANFFRNQQKDSYERLRLLVNDYKANGYTPVSIDFYTVVNNYGYYAGGAWGYGRGL